MSVVHLKSCDIQTFRLYNLQYQIGEVLRSKSIKVTFQNKDGKYKKWKLDGIAARVVQHEIDHLEGILFVDYLDAKEN